MENESKGSEKRKGPTDIKQQNAIDSNKKESSSPQPSYFEWLKSRLKVTLIVFIIAVGFAIAIFLSVAVWTFINQKLILGNSGLISQSPKKTDLYKSDEEFHIPNVKDESKLEPDYIDDVDAYNDISGPSEMDPDKSDKPTIIKSTGLNQVNLEADDDIVSHNAILHDESFDDVPNRGKEISALNNFMKPSAPKEGYLEEFRQENLDDVKASKLTPEGIIKTLKALEASQDKEPDEERSKPLKNLKVKTDNPSTKSKAEKTEHNTNIINKSRPKEPPGNPRPTESPKQMIQKPTVQNAARHTTVLMTETSDTPPMTLYRVTNAIKAGAVCLDGSAPAYYHRPGTGNSEKLWIIHFNGGAWCFDERACFERSHSSLGSTKKLPPSPPIIQGINSPDPSVNPDFFDWNLVWVVYCDGASFTGNREHPLIDGSGNTIYMRGKRVLNAIINDLLYNREFKLAEAIILTGSSAGSMTAIFQADYIASKFPRNIPVRVLSDAGFFIETASLGGKNLGAIFKHIYDMQNSSAGLNQDCVKTLGLGNAWQCFFPSRTARFIKTPMFVLNAAYDIWALIYFLDIDCKFPILHKENRRKRSTIKNIVSKSDSELEMIYQKLENDEKQNFFENIYMNSKRRRDISGFEIEPFFRHPHFFHKDIIPLKRLKNMNNLDSLKLPFKDGNTDDNMLKVFNSLQIQSHIDQSNYTSNARSNNSPDYSRISNFDTEKHLTTRTHKLSDKTSLKNVFLGLNNDDPKSPHSSVKSTKAFHRKKDLFHNTVKQVNMTTRKSKYLGNIVFDLSNKTINKTKFDNNSTQKYNASSANTTSAQNISSSSEKQIVSTYTTPLKNISKKGSLKVDVRQNNMPNSSRRVDINSSMEQRNSNSSEFPSVLQDQNNQSYSGLYSFFQPTVATPVQSVTSSSKKDYNESSKLRQIDLSHKQNSLPHSSQGYKRYNVVRSKSNSSKTRRSTSIAKEYINILRSDPPECTEKELSDALKYRGAIIHASNVLLSMPKSGRFLVSCIDHSLSLFDETWTSLIVAGKSIQQAFGDWFYERGNKQLYDFVDCPYPCNPTCP